jgi:hypothetical protein
MSMSPSKSLERQVALSVGGGDSAGPLDPLPSPEPRQRSA